MALLFPLVPVPPAVVVHPGSKGAIARQEVVEPVWPAGAHAWLSI